LDEFAEREAGDPNRRTIVITGGVGMGKSALIANWIARRQKNQTGSEKIIYHFIGESAAEGDYRKITERLINEMRDMYSLPQDEKNDKESLSGEEIKKMLQDVLFSVADRGRLVIALDGVDKLLKTDNAKTLNWLPAFPKNVKVIFSVTRNDETMDVFKRLKYDIFTVDALPLESRKQLANDYLKAFGKGLLPAQIDRIAKDPENNNPLSLRALLDELRVFGVHEQIDAEIDRYLAAPDALSFFTLILERLEEVYGDSFVKDALSLIAVSRRGLNETEILALTKKAPLYWSQLFNAIAGHVTVRGSLVAFSHNFIREAVQKRYLTPDVETECRRRIASYMEAAEEVPQKISKTQFAPCRK
jgi:preprotein translocase subunit SecA/nephrocystin-3